MSSDPERSERLGDFAAYETIKRLRNDIQPRKGGTSYSTSSTTRDREYGAGLRQEIDLTESLQGKLQPAHATAG